jgi:nucleoside-diphosphate-sugar epimerase
MKFVVTGSAGFIGSHLCERLVRNGHTVVGLDAFIPYYPRTVKEENLDWLRQQSNYVHHELDLRHDALADALDGADAVFHLAAMAGLAKSWTEFDLYQSCNVVGTQRLLEAARHVKSLRRFVCVSTSSVYGLYSTGDEAIPTRPISPYGLTKLAAEQLCRVYEQFDLPVVVLRYFSVYGPRQRPDMGYHRFIQALLENETITVYGDGQQIRGNTYIDDCVTATIAALEAPAGETYNVGGGETASVWDILHKLEKLTGKRARIRQASARPGDQRTTCADTTKLRRHLGWQPRTSLDEGLARQLQWHRYRMWEDAPVPVRAVAAY